MIRGAKTRLRALEHDNLPRCVRWLNDPEVRRYPMGRCPHDEGIVDVLHQEFKLWHKEKE
jgi:hypothetical protein